MKKLFLLFALIVAGYSTGWATQVTFDVDTDTKRVILEAGQTNDTELYTHFNLVTVTGPVNLDTMDSLIDANVIQISEFVTLSGVAAHSEDFGTFTGVTIPDGSDNKEALQALETAVEAGGASTWGAITGTLSDQTDLQGELDAKADSLTADENYVTDAQLIIIGNTSGANSGDVTMGTANGLSLIGQILSMSAATNSSPGAMTATLVTNLESTITLSGVAADSLNFGTFTGVTIPDGSDNKEALQALETAVESGGAGMVYPGAGIPLSTGSAWGTSYSTTTLQAALDAEDQTPTGAIDTSGASSNVTGPLVFSPTGTLPVAVDGKTFVYTGATGFLGNSILSYYDGTTPVYTVGFETLPTTTGEVPTFNSVTGKFDLNVPSGGSFAFDTYPVYEDSAHNSGIAVNATTLAVYSVDASKWLTVGLTDSLDPTPIIPTFTSAVVDGGGLQVIFSTPVTQGSGWLETLFTVDATVTGADIGMTFVDTDGTDTWNFTLDTAVVEADIVTLDYPTTSNGVESSTGDDLAALISEAVTNNTVDGGGLEDLSAYSEVSDLDGKLSATSTTITITGMTRTEINYIADDKGVDHFSGDFIHQYEAQIDTSVDTGMIVPWGMSNTLEALGDATNPCTTMRFFNLATPRIYLKDVTSGVEDSWTSAVAGVPYFITVSRDYDGGTSNLGLVTAVIRTGSHTGTEQDTLVINLTAQEDFQFFYAVSSNDDSSNETASGFTRNFNLGE